MVVRIVTWFMQYPLCGLLDVTTTPARTISMALLRPKQAVRFSRVNVSFIAGGNIIDTPVHSSMNEPNSTYKC